MSVTFRVRSGGRVTFKDYLIHRRFRPEKKELMNIRALDEICCDIHEGERVGIIGHNGAGKSTLLKALAGIYAPTSGTRRVEGKISSLFDVALGFEPDATGWQNIAYRGYIQGETPRSIRTKMQEVAEFSELGRFLDMPVRYYSSGMMIRLAFSIATSIEPEILLVDEVLAAGDLTFQTKARERMYAMIARSRIVVAVSHDLESLGKLCDEIIWLDHGRIYRRGAAADIIAAYREGIEQPVAVAA
jgi:lipopolysaccharide transport system ATP-binding protein